MESIDRIPEAFSRTARVWGEDAVANLADARVAVFGVGGVGGHLCEALARAGVGQIDLIDRDTVSLSNLNRQIVALHSTLGQPKVEVMRARILDINPACRVTVHEMFYLPETADSIDLSVFDYVADAVDTVAAKIELVLRCQAARVPLICAMGAGNKCHPEQFRIADLFRTNTDPLARVLRRELGERGISNSPDRDFIFPDTGFKISRICCAVMLFLHSRSILSCAFLPSVSAESRPP